MPRNLYFSTRRFDLCAFGWEFRAFKRAGAVYGEQLVERRCNGSMEVREKEICGVWLLEICHELGKQNLRSNLDLLAIFLGEKEKKRRLYFVPCLLHDDHQACL